MAGKFQYLIIGIIIIAQLMLMFLVMSLDDTPEFKTVMAILFGGDQSIAPPAFWIEHRTYFICGSILLLICHYRNCWMRYITAAQIFDRCRPTSERPPIPVHQASYFLSQNKITLMLIWLVKWCQEGLLTFHHRKGPYPWDLTRNKDVACTAAFDQQLLDDLFGNDDKISIAPLASKPNPAFKKLAKQLLMQTKEEIGRNILPMPGPWLAWAVLIGLFIETPFMNGLYPENPGLLPIHFAFAAFAAAVAFTFCHFFPSLLSGHKLAVTVAIICALSLAAIPHFELINVGISRPYFEFGFYFDIVAVIIVLVMKAPPIPADKSLLADIVGYKTYLEQNATQITQRELQWALGLQTEFDLIDINKLSAIKEFPAWIDSDDDDPRYALVRLQRTLAASLRRALGGDKSGDGGTRISYTNVGD